MNAGYVGCALLVFMVVAALLCAFSPLWWDRPSPERAKPSDTLTIGVELDAKDAIKSLQGLSDVAAAIKASMGDVDARVRVMSPKAGDTIAVSIERLLSAGHREQIQTALKSKLPEGVKVMVLDGGMALTHVEAPAADAQNELLCEVKAIRDEMRRFREEMGATAMRCV